MEAAVAHLYEVFGGIRTGRVSSDILDPLRVDYYGSPTPLGHIAAVLTSGHHMLVVNPYDPQAIPEIVKAINRSSLGFNAQADKGCVRVPIPALSGERREALAKHAASVAEEQRVAIRNVRRDSNRELERMVLPEDLRKRGRGSLDDTTKRYTEKVDAALAAKTGDLLGDTTRFTVADSTRRTRAIERGGSRGPKSK